MPGARPLASGRYQARFRDRDGKVKGVPGGVTYAHKREALRAATLHEEKVRSGPRRADVKMTWGDWCETWWPSRGVDASTAARDRGRLERYLYPQWRKVPIVDITRHGIRAWVAKLVGQGLAAATVQRIVHLFSASLAGAVDAELIPANPAAGLKLAAARTNLEHYLTWDEWEALAGELAGPYLNMATFLVMTGARWGEAAGLHWDRVDLARGTISLVEAGDDLNRVIKPRTKGKRARDVPLPAAVRELLPDEAPRGGTCGVPHEEGACRSTLVFPAPRGAMWTMSNFRRTYERAQEQAGLSHVRIHDLRHTYASWLIQNGVQLERVGKLLGHSSPLVTARYAHLAPGRHDDVLDVLEGLRGTNVARAAG